MTTGISPATALATLAFIILGQLTEAAPAAAAGAGGDLGDCRVVPGLPLQVRLNNGVEVPRIGFGTAGLGFATENSVALALAAGYRHVDTAQAQEWYREDAVGRAVKQATSTERTPPPPGRGQGEHEEGAEGAAEDGSGASPAGEEASESPSRVTLSREDVFVTTKIHPRDFSADRMRSMIETSDSNLQGVDLVLLHSPNCWPGSCPDDPTPWQYAWRELEKLYSAGTVRAIGVSNFSEGLLRELLEMADVVPAVVQNWMDPFHQDRAVRALCAQHGIAYVAYSTLGGQWAYRPSSSSSANPVSSADTLERIASAQDTSTQAVALSWALQSGAIVLPRSSNPDRIRDNLEVFVGIGALSSRSDDGDPSESSSGSSGGGVVEQECRAIPSDGSLVQVFLTEEDMDSIGRLDGTIGA